MATFYLKRDFILLLEVRFSANNELNFGQQACDETKTTTTKVMPFFHPEIILILTVRATFLLFS